MRRLATGVYDDGTGGLHIDTSELLEATGYEDTPENRDALEAAARDAFVGEVTVTDEPVDVLIDAGGVGFVIEDLYAYVSVHDDGDEGVIGANISGLGMMPLVAADRTRLDQLRPYAVRCAQASGRPVRLVRFTSREDIEVIEP